MPANSGNAYASVPYILINSDLDYIGALYLREAPFTTASTSAALTQEFNLLAQSGKKFDFAFTSDNKDIASNLKLIDQFILQNPGSFQSIEGINEINYFPFTYEGFSGQDAAVKFQTDLKAAVANDPISKDVQVIDFTGGGGLYSSSTPPEPVDGIADLATVHYYPANGDPPSFYVNYVYYVQYGHAINAPYVLTEGGYNTDIQSSNGVSVDVQAKQTLDLWLDSTQSGATQSYLYELLDDNIDPTDPYAENH